jgi:hypothetical protein
MKSGEDQRRAQGHDRLKRAQRTRKPDRRRKRQTRPSVDGFEVPAAVHRWTLDHSDLETATGLERDHLRQFCRRRTRRCCRGRGQSPGCGERQSRSPCSQRSTSGTSLGCTGGCRPTRSCCYPGTARPGARRRTRSCARRVWHRRALRRPRGGPARRSTLAAPPRIEAEPRTPGLSSGRACRTSDRRRCCWTTSAFRRARRPWRRRCGHRGRGRPRRTR